MIRRYHRWLALVFGIFLLWISATGVLSQVGKLVNDGGFETAASEAAARARADAAIPPGFTCPETMTCRAKPATPPKWNVGYLHHIHSGEEFGPVGVLISIASGLALFFFAASGLWMYVELYRGRLALVRKGKKVPPGRYFWK